MTSKLFTVLVVLAFHAFCQLSVISGRVPVFPPKIDEIIFSLKIPHTHMYGNSQCDTVPKDFYDEFRQSIDSTIQYVDAVRLKRKEITGNAHGPKFNASLIFSVEKKQALKVSFSGNDFKSALLDAAADKYPYVVVFKPAVAKKLRIEYDKLRSKKSY